MKKSKKGEKMDCMMEDSMEEGSEPHEHEIESAAETLLRAEQIKKDVKMMPYVNKYLKKKMSAIESIADIRKKAQDMGEYGEDDED